MLSSRRCLLLMSFAVMPGLLLAAQDPLSPERTRAGRRRPDGSDDPGNNSPNLPAASSKALLEERQKNIKKDVEKLYDLAAQLKTEVEKTDATTVLSVGMLKKADEIEKLAKQIKDHAKG